MAEDNKENFDFEINFTDITVLEADGKYSKAKEIMSKEISEEWMLETEATIISEFGEAFFILHLYYDGRVYIMNFSSKNNADDVYYNPDIRFLSFWAQESGWKVPQPFPDLIKENMDFWRYFWDTGIVDSDYLDKKIGKKEY